MFYKKINLSPTIISVAFGSVKTYFNTQQQRILLLM